MIRLIEQTYPSGRKVKNTLDAEGDLALVQSSKSNAQGLRLYANAFTYTAAGAVSSMRLGNGLRETTQFNSRLQPTMIGLGTGSAVQNRLRLDYAYGELQSNPDESGLDATKNNGNLARQTITVPTVMTSGTTHAGFTAVQNYQYDSLNRLKSAVENVQSLNSSNQPVGSQSLSWRQTYTFDRYGNRRFDAANTTTIPAGCAEAVCNPQIDPATNKLIGYQFDGAGNTKTDANGQIFIYDGENKQTEVRTAANAVVGQYFYNGDGQRIKKIVPSTGETTVFVYDASARLVAEYSTIVEPVSTAKTSYLTQDHLGSPRILTDQNGAVISRRDFLPFGEEITSGTGGRTTAQGYGGQDSIRQKFTGYERDAETDLDFAQARMYHKNLGRFTSVDPIKMTGDRMIDPQQINLYGYTRNNPLNLIDPSGMIIDFEKDDKGNLTKKGKESKKHYDEYVKKVRELAAKDPQKYGSLLDTITKLTNSEVTYIIKVDTKSSSETSEGFISTDGEKIFVNIRNLGNDHEKFDINGRFAHELEHARQFDNGELSFNKTANGKWVPNPLTYDIYDEVKAFKEQLKLSPEIKDNELLKYLRRGDVTDSERAARLSSSSYPRLNKTETNNTNIWGYPPGKLVRPTEDPARTSNVFGRVYKP